MKGIASLFSQDMQKELKKRLEIELSDEHCYSIEELEELYYEITEAFPFEYDERGELCGISLLYEDMINVFVNNKLPM